MIEYHKKIYNFTVGNYSYYTEHGYVFTTEYGYVFTKFYKKHYLNDYYIEIYQEDFIEAEDIYMGGAYIRQQAEIRKQEYRKEYDTYEKAINRIDELENTITSLYKDMAGESL